MEKHFVKFWRRRTIDSALRDRKLLDYGASNQYQHVKAGDTVWIVSIHKGRLHLAGSILVDQLTDCS